MTESAGASILNGEGKALLEYANQMDCLFGQIRERFASKNEAPDSLTLYSTGNYFSLAFCLTL